MREADSASVAGPVRDLPAPQVAENRVDKNVETLVDQILANLLSGKLGMAASKFGTVMSQFEVQLRSDMPSMEDTVNKAPSDALTALKGRRQGEPQICPAPRPIAWEGEAYIGGSRARAKMNPG